MEVVGSGMGSVGDSVGCRVFWVVGSGVGSEGGNVAGRVSGRAGCTVLGGLRASSLRCSLQS